MKELRRVKVLTEDATQFHLTLPKSKVRQLIKPAEDNRYYVRVDFEDDLIKVIPLEMVAKESDLRCSVEELRKQLGIGEEDANGA